MSAPSPSSSAVRSSKPDAGTAGSGGGGMPSAAGRAPAAARRTASAMLFSVGPAGGLPLLRGTFTTFAQYPGPPPPLTAAAATAAAAAAAHGRRRVKPPSTAAWPRHATAGAAPDQVGR
jgi:hypothetical protein